MMLAQTTNAIVNRPSIKTSKATGTRLVWPMAAFMVVAIIVGLISGTYSSVFIASAFVDFWKTMEAKRQAKKLAVQAGLAANAKAALVAANPGKPAKVAKAAKR